jgi:hypothetical protein
MHGTNMKRDEYLTRDYKTPTGIHRRLLAFYGEGAVVLSTVCHWVIKTRDSGGNLDLDYQPQPGSSGTATHCLNKQTFDEFFQGN